MSFFKGFFKGGTEIPEPDQKALPAEEEAVLEKVAHKVVDSTARLAIRPALSLVFEHMVKPPG